MSEVAVGFTGTRRGMTPAQRRKVIELLLEIQPTVVSHGDCVGADCDFDAVVRGLWLANRLPGVKINIYPPKNAKHRAYCPSTPPTDVIWPPAEYLERNQSIVSRSAMMIATPHQMQEVLRSGTWSTIRKAHHAGVMVYIVLPDGSLKS